MPPSVVATVMVLQRLEGLSDWEAVDRYAFDVRWRYAAGVGGYARGGWTRFAHTVLVDMRERLRRSARPNRIFEVGVAAAAAAGLVGRRRVLDSTPLYDAVATMDTVTLIRSALRALLPPLPDSDLAVALRRGADAAAMTTPARASRDRLGRPGRPRGADRFSGPGRFAVLAGRWTGVSWPSRSGRPRRCWPRCSARTLTNGTDGVFRIARRVAKDRVISTVDPDARHGHKTAARGFDGYKGHAAVDPDSEIITATTVTPGNAGDATVAEDLLADLLGEQAEPTAVEAVGVSARSGGRWGVPLRREAPFKRPRRLAVQGNALGPCQ